MERVKINKRAIIFIFLVLIIATACFLYIRGGNYYIGEIEGVTVSHCAEVSGKILESPVQLGSPIKKGEIIAVIDNTNQKYVIEQLNLNLEKAKLAVKSSKIGKGGTADNNYNVAKANYDSAVVTAEKSKQDFLKAKNLYEEAAITEEEFLNAKVAFETAENAVENFKAQLYNTSDKTAGNTADIEVVLMESQVNQQKEILKKYTIYASCDGIIMSKNYGEGDVIAAGYNIADISSDKERYGVFYYPVEKLDRIKYNQKVSVLLGDRLIEAKIKYIDVSAQYVPKSLQSRSNRNQKSVRVKVLLPKDCIVNIGQKIKVKL